jgi:hypothetical protein
MALIHDPQPAASAYAIAEVLGIAEQGILSAETRDEALVNHCALMASATALHPERYAAFRQRLLALPERSAAQLVAHALVWGFGEKWQGR